MYMFKFVNLINNFVLNIGIRYVLNIYGNDLVILIYSNLGFLVYNLIYCDYKN